MAQSGDTSATRGTPKDIEVMAAILKQMGIKDYEPRILNQMAELSYKIASNIIEDAQICSTHANKKSIDADDVKLAIKLHRDNNRSNAPFRKIIAKMAKQRNSMPLPLIKPSAGLRLPADRYCLTACNYQLKSSPKKTKTDHTVSGFNLSNASPNTVNKGSPIASPNKSGPIAPIVTKANSILTTPVNTKPISNIPKTVTSPIIKFSDGSRAVTSTLSSAPTVVSTSGVDSSVPHILPQPSAAAHILPQPSSVPHILPQTSSVPHIMPQPSSVPHILIPTVGVMNPDMKLSTEVSPIKRKLEDDDNDE